MMAIAIRELLLEAVGTESTVEAVGGVTVEAGESDHSDERPSEDRVYGHSPAKAYRDVSNI